MNVDYWIILSRWCPIRDHGLHQHSVVHLVCSFERSSVTAFRPDSSARWPSAGCSRLSVLLVPQQRSLANRRDYYDLRDFWQGYPAIQLQRLISTFPAQPLQIALCRPLSFFRSPPLLYPNNNNKINKTTIIL